MARMLLRELVSSGPGSPTRWVSLGLMILPDSAPIAMATLVVAPSAMPRGKRSQCGPVSFAIRYPR